MDRPLIVISSIFPIFSVPNRDSAPTNDESNIGLISESKMRSNKYMPVSLQIIIPFKNLEISEF